MEKREPGRPRHPDVLTPTEWRIADAVRHGLSRREIARRRGTSADAVKYHLRNITAKLGLDSVAQLRDWEGYPMTTPSTVGGPSDALALQGLGQVSLFVRDVERAAAFYRDTLGLTHLFTAGALAFFDVGGVRLYLHACGAEEWRPSSILYFRVADIAGGYAALEAAGVHTTGAPHIIHADQTTGTQEWMAFFTDPEGNTLALMATANSLRVERNDERRRFEAYLDDELAGVAEFIARGDDVVIFTHTEVEDAYEGQGVGSRLAAGALDQVRESGLKVQATCTFFGRYIREHDEYQDLVDSDGPPLAGA